MSYGLLRSRSWLCGDFEALCEQLHLEFDQGLFDLFDIVFDHFEWFEVAIVVELITEIFDRGDLFDKTFKFFEECTGLFDVIHSVFGHALVEPEVFVLAEPVEEFDLLHELSVVAGLSPVFRLKAEDPNLIKRSLEDGAGLSFLFASLGGGEIDEGEGGRCGLCLDCVVLFCGEA